MSVIQTSVGNAGPDIQKILHHLQL